MKLYYFAGFKGMSAVAQAIMQYGNIPYEFVGYTFEEFAENKSKFPMGHMPVLEFDNGDMLCQSYAISMYAAQKAGLWPTDPLEAAYCASVAFNIDEIINAQKWTIMKVTDPEQKEKNTKTFVEQTLPDLVSKIEKYVQKTGTPGYAVGSSLTIADFTIAETIDMLKSMDSTKPFVSYFENDTFNAIYKTVQEAKMNKTN